MRIALVVPGFAAEEELDFAIPALSSLARLLATRHDLHVFTLRYPHRRGVYPFHGATVHAFGWGTTGGLSRLRLLQQALAAVVGLHRRQPFDLLHGLWADEPGFTAATAGRLLQRPAVVSLLGGELVGFPDIGYGGQLSRANRLLTRWALRHASAVTAGSRFLHELAAQHASAGKLRVLPLGVDTQLFAPEEPAPAVAGPRFTFRAPLPASPAAATPGHLLHVASLSPVKDQATLLDALAMARNSHPALHLHIVGAGPLQPALAGQVDRLGLAAAVTFHGEALHTSLPAWYRAADLFVLSSRYESQSLVALEAAACGCPVVGTSVGVLPELLDPEQLAPVGDAPALAAVISRALDDPARRARWSRAGRDRTVARYSLDRTVADLEALYLELIEGGR